MIQSSLPGSLSSLSVGGCSSIRKAGSIPPELSAVLKHEPERRSGAAQPALLVRLEGKTRPGKVEHNPRGESVEFGPTLAGFVIREASRASRVDSLPFSHSGDIWTTSRSDLAVHV